ncbi:GAF domain-containing protein [Fusarium pseudocircinatum]|uniref:GAF domain-containing protein n=1 Tax=Fusarium pseudocircinatum TaxID=56676 RepID=A0A8H5NWI3_9HYPO|nr:GAF domain-containing protein [Fusarium pseudocircinatum]
MDKKSGEYTLYADLEQYKTPSLVLTLLFFLHQHQRTLPPSAPPLSLFSPNRPLCTYRGGQPPSNLNQWRSQQHQEQSAPDNSSCHGSLINAPAPDSDFGLLCDVSPFLDLPLLDFDFSSQGVYQGNDASWNFGQNRGEGLFDQIMIPDMNTLDTITQLDVGDGFLAQEQPLITVNSSPLEQPSTSSTPHPPATTTNKSPSSSIPGTSTFSLHPSPSSSSGSSRKRKSSPEDEESAITLKRQRNTLAARKYRQKRLDRISELEEALAAMTNERDDMRLQLARREAEVDALREMMGKK